MLDRACFVALLAVHSKRGIRERRGEILLVSPSPFLVVHWLILNLSVGAEDRSFPGRSKSCLGREASVVQTKESKEAKRETEKRRECKGKLCNAKEYEYTF